MSHQNELSCSASVRSLIASQNQDKSSEKTKKLYYNLIVCTLQTVIGYLCLDGCVGISLHFMAKDVGEIENAGLGLAYTCVNILLIPLGFGINQSLNIHTSQALGSEKITLAKTYLTLNIYIVLVFLIPISLVLFFLKTPLSYTIPLANRGPTADAAWDFLYYMLPSNILAIEFEGLKTFMIAHQVVYPFTYIHIVTLCTHLFFSWLFITKYHLGIQGAGYAILSTEILNLIGLFLFVSLTKLKKTVFGGVTLKYNILRHKDLTISFLKTSFPIIVHIYAEFFVFFLLTFVALSLDVDQMNAHLAVQNTSGIIFRFPISLQLALMSYVGNEMGKLQIKNAKRYTIAGIIIFFVFTFLCIILLWFLRDYWVAFYATKPEIKEIMIEVLPWMIFGLILIDGMQGTLNGALKGIEKQNLVTYSTLFTYYVIGVPLVIVFAYSWGLNLKVKGIWQAFGIANLCLFILYFWALLATNWNEQAKKIRNRVMSQNLITKPIRSESQSQQAAIIEDQKGSLDKGDISDHHQDEEDPALDKFNKENE